MYIVHLWRWLCKKIMSFHLIFFQHTHTIVIKARLFILLNKMQRGSIVCCYETFYSILFKIFKKAKNVITFKRNCFMCQIQFLHVNKVKLWDFFVKTTIVFILITKYTIKYEKELGKEWIMCSCCNYIQSMLKN